MKVLKNKHGSTFVSSKEFHSFDKLRNEKGIYEYELTENEVHTAKELRKRGLVLRINDNGQPNTKPTRKKRLSKKKQQELAKKLESSVANVSKKGLFFKSRNKDGSYNIVDGAKKEVLVENILLPESQSDIKHTKTSKQKENCPTC